MINFPNFRKNGVTDFKENRQSEIQISRFFEAKFLLLAN